MSEHLVSKDGGKRERERERRYCEANSFNS